MEEKGAGITAEKEKDFSEWYTQILIKSGFVDYTAVSGALAFRPDGYFAWEAIQAATDKMFKAVGIQNVYFPLFIPEKLLEKEKAHVKGFSPEVAWVTHTGKTKLEERLAVRPTSETIMYDSYARWIRSWRDLPLRFNQWNNAVRWEFKHPTPLLRSREFLWNEGHTVFASQEEADAERDVVLGIYEKILTEYMALPGIIGKKSATETFAGALATYSIEHLMPDGSMIQGPDFHSDGQNFAKAFGIEFIDKDEKKKFAFQNTFAISTRELGVMVAIHGDDKGLVLPPNVARIQVVIVPIYKEKTRETVMMGAESLAKMISPKLRVHIDSRDSYSPGWKFNEWELKGVPVRVEIGEREIKDMKLMVARRDTGEKISVPLASAGKEIEELLNRINKEMYARAKKLLESRIYKVANMNDIKEVIGKGGVAHGYWCGSAECEAKVKEETGAKITNMPLDKQGKKGKCVNCGKEATNVANFAKSY